jgi:hypothetical protein
MNPLPGRRDRSLLREYIVQNREAMNLTSTVNGPR